MRTLGLALATALLAGTGAPALAETVGTESEELCGAYSETAQSREAFCSQVIADSPRDMGGWLGRAQARIELNRFAKALSDLDEALRLAPGNIDVLYYRAVCRHALEQDEGALADINATLKGRPGDTDALTIRAGILVSLKRYDDALQDAQAILKERPDDMDARRRVTQIENAVSRASG